MDNKKSLKTSNQLRSIISVRFDTLPYMYKEETTYCSRNKLKENCFVSLKYLLFCERNHHTELDAFRNFRHIHIKCFLEQYFSHLLK